ncbi:MAG TPA: hypothetical protein VGM08_02230 [Candidatus Saccharimonadales bacterium]|jgi:hypothetical protein
MKRSQHESGYSLVQVLLVLIALIIIGFTGYFVHQSQKNTNKTLDNANKVAQGKSAPKAVVVSNFAGCKQAASSKMLETYPEQCVTKTGQTFTDTSQAAAPPTASKAAADSPTPAAGTCETTDGAVVTVKLTEGVPDPRCSQVAASQTLSVVNPTNQAVTITLGGQSVTISPGKTGAIATPFGDYLQTGDHVMQTGLYGGSGPEIYLPAS